MVNPILIAAGADNLAACLDVARAHGLGLELQAFSSPETLTCRLASTLADHKRALKDFEGKLGVHGAFYDVSSASLDPAIVEVTRRRYRQNLHVAAELGADYLVFHLNYLGVLKLPNYKEGWHERQVAFWEQFVQEAAREGIPVLLENAWEDDPSLITSILADVRSDYLRACLDVAHATLYSPAPLATWIELFAPYVTCCHINNHDGELDLHWPLDRGAVDYAQVLERLALLPQSPFLCLEMPDIESVSASLAFLGLDQLP